MLFVISAFGGKVSWEGDGAPFGESDPSISHQVSCHALIPMINVSVWNMKELRFIFSILVLLRGKLACLNYHDPLNYIIFFLSEDIPFFCMLIIQCIL